MPFDIDIWVIPPSHSKNMVAMMKFQVLRPYYREMISVCRFGLGGGAVLQSVSECPGTAKLLLLTKVALIVATNRNATRI